MEQDEPAPSTAICHVFGAMGWSRMKLCHLQEYQVKQIEPAPSDWTSTIHRHTPRGPRMQDEADLTYSLRPCGWRRGGCDKIYFLKKDSALGVFFRKLGIPIGRKNIFLFLGTTRSKFFNTYEVWEWSILNLFLSTLVF